MNKIVTVTMLVATFLVVGCSEQNNAPEQVQEDSQKPKTVVVDEGMSKEEEDKLEQRIAELEEKVNDQSAEQPTQEAKSTEPTQETESAEDAALAVRPKTTTRRRPPETTATPTMS